MPRQTPNRAASPTHIKEAIWHRAHHLGFDTMGICEATLPDSVGAALAEYTERGYHGDMTWLVENQDVRSHPQALMPEAQRAIILGMNYGPDHNPLNNLEHKDRGLISVYAKNRDYHDVIKGRLKQLASWMVSQYGGNVKVFVDTAPVMEKPLAAQTALGWQGKHSCVVSREFGNWLFLGVIYTTLPLPSDDAETDHCGSCTRCLDICATDAFDNARQLNASKCISYLTIEHKGHIAAEFRQPMGNRIYGCDDCLAVCPWNKFAQTAQEAAFHARDELDLPKLSDLLTLDDAEFRKLFSRSPIKRIGRDRFIRNVLIAAGNSDEQALIAKITPLLEDNSPLVRAMAVWALAQLEPGQLFKQLSLRDREEDPDVLQEWTNALD